MRKDKNRIINEMVMNAAEVMEAKAFEMEMTAEMFEEKGDADCAQRLRENVSKARQAIEIIRDNEGCWA